MQGRESLRRRPVGQHQAESGHQRGQEKWNLYLSFHGLGLLFTVTMGKASKKRLNAVHPSNNEHQKRVPVRWHQNSVIAQPRAPRPAPR
jgi:hypothetical protein